jgi:hypothetical protein
VLKSVDDFFPTLGSFFLFFSTRWMTYITDSSLGFSSIMNDDDSRRPPIPSSHSYKPLAYCCCYFLCEKRVKIGFI